ncbi:NmrA family NAD(P)-binding protein [Paraburkholderia kururiensis]|uniref:NmrA family NAD(P)-binding protein n=1 Tax=Paraburkholderia kururiensis TaxID=984307 RepID=UPI0005A966B0|nr:NAD(P)H-binding protein [Paraburkholderia kururiensis]
MFVIFGASGNVGRTTAAALRESGRRVRAVVRDRRHAPSLEALGCEVMVVDLNDREAMDRAIRGAQAVQMLCPVPVGAHDPAAAMRDMIDVSAAALRAQPPHRVLVLSDYGAERDTNTGITRLFHYLEQQVKPLPSNLLLLRSAEHMENWARVLPAARATGMLPSLHHPLTKRFPTVAARDVGLAAAALLQDEAPTPASRVVSIEGPRRVSAWDVASALGHVLDRNIEARALPREEWAPVLQRAGLSAHHTQLIVDLYDAHNTGLIDVEAGATERLFGTTTVEEAMSGLAQRPDVAARA